MIADTMESIRPKFNMFSSLQQAQDAVNELSKEYDEKISKFIKNGFPLKACLTILFDTQFGRPCQSGVSTQDN